MSFPSDLEIARSVTPRPIADVAHELGFRDDEIELYGNTKAKITIEGIERKEREHGRGKYVLVTAISPTPLGEGKSTTTVGLAQGLAADRQEGDGRPAPALPGPRVRDQGRRRGRRLLPGHPDGGLQPPPHGRRPRDRRRAQPRRGLHRQPHPPRQRAGHRRQQRPLAAGPGHQRPRPARRRRGAGRQGQRLPPPGPVRDHRRVARSWRSSRWRSDLKDLRARLGRIVLATRKDGTPITAEDLKVAGSMAVLLKDALKPNLMQTLEGGPAFVHCGPFANIAHGNNSILADRAALAGSDIVVTEAGFGADMGAEKFFDIKCRAIRAHLRRGGHRGHDPRAQDERRRGQGRGGQAARPGAAREQPRGRPPGRRQPRQADRERPRLRRAGGRGDQRLPDRHRRRDRRGPRGRPRGRRP